MTEKIVTNNRRMFLLFNHSLTQAQKEEAISIWDIKLFVPLPSELKKIWEQVSADQKEISDSLAPIYTWLKKQAQKNDIILIQGDFGATWLMVNYAFKRQLLPIYSVTIRDAHENMESNGCVKTTHFFKHRMFRLYGK